jgi:hypothetical protein
MNQNRSEAKVAKILTERELVLNRGTDSGIEIGMRFAIQNMNGQNIVDPETGEDLGSLDFSKTIVKIIDVYPKMSVAKTFRQFKVPGQRATGIYAFSITEDHFGRPGTSDQIETETLRTDEKMLKDELSEEESYVKIEDLAVQVTDEDTLGI